MKKVIVYVEGPSDKLSMEKLLESLISDLKKSGIEVTFHEAPSGDKKLSLINKVPKRAVNILRNQDYSIVIVLPDLYPADIGFKHKTFKELKDGIFNNFKDVLTEKGINDKRMINRFHVFCFKYDLEALVLAAKDSLFARLGVEKLKMNWKIPVEDQNHDNPPKQLVEKLFKANNNKYKATVDAPLILGNSDYSKIADACPQCFKPFVDFLKELKQD